MIRALKEIIDSLMAGPEAGAAVDREEAVRLATAVLMVETARADHAEKIVESAVVCEQLQRYFGLSAEEAEELMALAEAELDDAVSLQRFTRHLHDTLEVSEKLAIVEMLWRVAFADLALHPQEEALVRKLAALLYMRESEVLKLRNQVAEESSDGR